MLDRIALKYSSASISQPKRSARDTRQQLLPSTKTEFVPLFIRRRLSPCRPVVSDVEAFLDKPFEFREIVDDCIGLMGV